jgi:hypothetical protein
LGTLVVGAALVLALGAALLGGGVDAGTGVAAARPKPPTPPPTQPPLDRRVVVIGDSVILGAQADLYARLGFAGWNITAFAAAESFFTWNAPALVDQLRPFMGEVVVIELGPNDAADLGLFSASIDQVMAHLQGIPRVYWVNMRQFRPWVPAANAEIAAAATRFPNLRVIDWDARSTPDLFTVGSDGLHLPPYGRAAMAEVVGVALDGYLAERTAPLPTPTTASSDVEVRSAHARHGAALGSGVPVMPMLAIGGALLLAIGAAAIVRNPGSRRSTLSGR